MSEPESPATPKPPPVPAPAPSEPDTTPRPILPTDPPKVPREELDRIATLQPYPRTPKKHGP